MAFSSTVENCKPSSESEQAMVNASVALVHVGLASSLLGSGFLRELSKIEPNSIWAPFESIAINVEWVRGPVERSTLRALLPPPAPKCGLFSYRNYFNACPGESKCLLYVFTLLYS